MTHEQIDAAIAKYGLSLTAVFVPWSQSRNRQAKEPSLNWQVTLLRDGRAVLTTDYSAGSAHAPSDKAPKQMHWDYHESRIRRDLVAKECETGKRCVYRWGAVQVDHTDKTGILPDTRNVLYSLVADASVLDAGGFVEWASDSGYDSDSITAKATYDACVEIALRLRAGLGDAGLTELQAAFVDY